MFDKSDEFALYRSPARPLRDITPAETAAAVGFLVSMVAFGLWLGTHFTG